MPQKAALIAALVLAHSWYPGECCGGSDCRPVPCAGFTEEMLGTMRIVVLADGGMRYYARRDLVRPSPDGLCHACFWPGTLNMRCVFWPQTVA